MIKFLMTAASAALFSVAAQAGDHFYIQANAGSPSSDMNPCVDGAGNPATCSIQGQGAKLLAGYKVTPNFALEATYWKLGKDHGLTQAGDQYDGKVSAYGIGGALHFDITDAWAGVARFGFARVRTKASALYAGDPAWTALGTESHAKYYAGGGLSYAITPTFRLNGDFDYTKVRSEAFQEHGMRLLSLGGSLHF